MVGTILEFMTTQHGHKPVYGWIISLIVVAGMFASIAAAGARARVVRTRKLAWLALAQTDLYAEVITSNPARRVKAHLRKLNSRLELSLIDSSKAYQEPEVGVFSDVAELEAYLEAHTSLRIGDFRPTPR